MTTKNQNANSHLYKLLCLMQEVEKSIGMPVNHAAKEVNVPYSARTLYKILAETRDAVDVYSMGSHQSREEFLDFAVRVIPIEALLKHPAIALIQENAQKLLGYSSRYKFISTIEIVEKFIENGFFPVSAWVYKPNPHTKPTEKEQWLAKLYHVVCFVDFGSICDPKIGYKLVDLYKKTKKLPTIELHTAHDAKNSFKLYPSMLDCSSGLPDITSGFMYEMDHEDPKAFRLIHDNVLTSDADIAETCANIRAIYPNLSADIALLEKTNLSKTQQSQLGDMLKEQLFGKRDVEVNITELTTRYDKDTSMFLGVNDDITPKGDYFNAYQRMEYIVKKLEEGLDYKVISTTGKTKGKSISMKKKIPKKDSLRQKKITNIILRTLLEVIRTSSK